MDKLKIKQKLNKQGKGDTKMYQDMAKKACKVLRKYDRMPNNAYGPTIAKVITMLEMGNGTLPLIEFTCGRVKPKYLVTDTPEKYIPLDEPWNSDGLVYPRIPMLKKIVGDLARAGVPAKTVFLQGDNNWEAYINLMIPGVTMNAKTYSERRRTFRDRLREKLEGEFLRNLEVWSLGEDDEWGLGIGAPATLFEPTEEMIREETISRQQAFATFYSRYFPEPSPEQYRETAKQKIMYYTELGEVLEMLGGVLLSTQGSDTLRSWLLPMEEYCADGANFCRIFPYIRKEVLQN